VIKIKFKSYWTNKDEEVADVYMKLTKQNDGVWKDLQITLDDDYDFLIVQGSTRVVKEEDYSKIILIQNEPKYYRDTFYVEIFRNKLPCELDPLFYKVLDINRYCALDHWLSGISFAEIEKDHPKSKLMSSVLSSYNSLGFDTGKRIGFAINFLNDIPNYHLYGRDNGLFQHVDSYQGETGYLMGSISPYKYHYNCENRREKNYFTEKITRGILFECLQFYYGCPNITDFIDPRCFIEIDLENQEKCFEIVRQTIMDCEWERRLKYIKRQKEILMNDNNVLNILHNVIETGEFKWKKMD